MNLSDIERATRQVAEFVQAYVEPVLFGAGAVGALIALILVWRFLRTGELHAKLGTVAVTLATAFAMEGMFEVAHGPLGLNVAGSLMFCATFEIVMLHQGTLAAHKLNAQRPAGSAAPDISRHMAFVWIVALASGVIASTASNSVTEVVLRLATPPLAAGIWYMSLYADRERTGPASNWIWTPQRVGVQLGLLRPGDADDLDEVYRRRRVDRMVRLAGRIDTGWKSLAGRRSLRLRRLAELADAAMLAEVRERYQRGATVELLIFDAIDEAPADAPRVASVSRQIERSVSRAVAPVDASAVALLSHSLSHDDASGDATPQRPRRRSTRRMSDAERVTAAVTYAHEEGVSARQAAQKFSANERTVQRRLSEIRKINGHQFETTGQSAG